MGGRSEASLSLEKEIMALRPKLGTFLAVPDPFLKGRVRNHLKLRLKNQLPGSYD